MRHRIITADVLRWARLYKGAKFHALLCDPPYHLTSITKRFGKPGSKPPKDGVYKRASTGFMNESWDGGDIAFRPETWAALAEHLFPGAFGMAFASSRGFHRMAVAIEDAGLIIHPMIGWVYGSGFPKATRIDTQIDKTDARDERKQREYRFTEWMRSTGITSKQIDEATGTNMGGHYLTAKSQPAIATANLFDKLRSLLPTPPEWVEEYVKQRTIESETFKGREVTGQDKSGKTAMMGGLMGTEPGGEFDITAPATDLARAWEGHRYGLQAMKPALEPIIVFQKPYSGKPLDSIVEHGAGAINIEGGRIGSQEVVSNRWDDNAHPFGDGAGNTYTPHKSQGRWPANLALSHNPGCVRVGERRVSGSPAPYTRKADGKNANVYSEGMGQSAGDYAYSYADADGKETIAAYDCEPNCPVYLLDRQSGVLKSGLLTPEHKARDWGYHGGKRDRPTLRNTPADKGGASRFFHNSDWQLENAEPIRYQAKASRKERDAGLNALLNGCECVTIELSYNHKAKDKQWQKQAQKVKLQVDMERSPKKVIAASIAKPISDIEWNTVLFGSSTTAQSLLASKCITSMAINLTTESKISNWLHQRFTNEFIAGVNCETASGGSPAPSVKNSSPLIITIGISQKKDGPYVGDAKNATSESLSEKNVNVNKGRLIDGEYYQVRNGHPTLKPIALTRWLATLLLPPDEYEPRRLLVPFSGSGSEMIGAHQAGWDECLGIELGAEYVEIAEARLAHWLAQAEQMEMFK